MYLATFHHLQLLFTAFVESWVMGKSKLATRPAHEVRRLELCAAVLAVELADFITDEMKLEFH